MCIKLVIKMLAPSIFIYWLSFSPKDGGCKFFRNVTHYHIYQSPSVTFRTMKISNSPSWKRQIWFSFFDRQGKVADTGARTESILGFLIGVYDIHLTCMDQRKGYYGRVVVTELDFISTVLASRTVGMKSSSVTKTWP